MSGAQHSRVCSTSSPPKASRRRWIESHSHEHSMSYLSPHGETRIQGLSLESSAARDVLHVGSSVAAAADRPSPKQRRPIREESRIDSSARAGPSLRGPTRRLFPPHTVEKTQRHPRTRARAQRSEAGRAAPGARTTRRRRSRMHVTSGTGGRSPFVGARAGCGPRAGRRAPAGQTRPRARGGSGRGGSSARVGACDAPRGRDMPEGGSSARVGVCGQARRRNAPGVAVRRRASGACDAPRAGETRDRATLDGDVTSR